MNSYNYAHFLQIDRRQRFCNSQTKLKKREFSAPLCVCVCVFCLDIRCLALNRMFPIRRSRNKRPKELEIHEHP